MSTQNHDVSLKNKIIRIFEEWSANPVVIITENLNYPIDKIPFPTITFCDMDNQPNLYGLAAKIMNNVDYLCFDDDPLRYSIENFKYLQAYIYIDIITIIQKASRM